MARAPVPPYRAQLATLVPAPPAGAGWVHETKYDGYRIGCALEGGRATLWSRRGNDWTAQFPEVARAAEALRARGALLDGEVAAVLPDGRTSFQALQNALSGGHRTLAYFVFDLLWLDGEDLSRRPLLERKAALRALVGERSGIIRCASHVEAPGPEVLREACRLGLEGIVSKRADAPYRPGRNATWTKAKCIARQELVVGGFTDPEGSRVGLGALLVGYHQGGALRFAGKVGTGFTQASARALRARLDRLERKEPPFEPRPPGPLGRRAHWVRPELVAEVAFSEWTSDGKIRHPSFQGLREDKRAEDVIREAPAAPGPPAPLRPAPPRSAGRSRRAAAAKGAEPGAEIGGVRISHPERVVFPGAGRTGLALTRADVARYYDAVADAMVPHLRGRPLALLRCPQGLSGGCRLLKHPGAWAPPGVRRVRIQEKTRAGEYLVADDREALLSLVQAGVLELHTWSSTVERLEQPDRLVLDLDPGPEVPWAEVVRAARLLRSALEALGLAAFVKTTGGAGLHVVTPLVPRRRWEDCLAFARGLAATVARHEPRAFAVASARAGRERKIRIDHQRSGRASTSVAAFSLRARPGAPASVPLAWDELGPRLRPGALDARAVPRRLARQEADPWAGWARAARALTDAHLAAVGEAPGGGGRR